MTLAALVLATALGNPLQTGSAPCGSYLYQPAFCVDHLLRLPVHPYVPQPGDIYLSTDNGFVARLGHKLVCSGGPHHSGIIFALPDGQMALLEGGPENTLFIRVLDLLPTLTKYASTKRVWIRQRCVPLTPEQSHRLTVFALAAADRHFAGARMVAEITPLRAKGPLRTPLIGPPHAACFDPDCPEPGMRRKYFCSELVTEACVAACLLDPETTRPMSTFPRELFFGDSKNAYLKCHLDMSEWAPPARWTPCPGSEPHLKERPLLDGDKCEP